MPLIRIDFREGRTDAELKTLLDAAHEPMLEASKVPTGDRYWIVTEHKPSRMITEDAGVSIPRTKDVVVVQVFTRPRAEDAKQAFYRLLTEKLRAACGIAPSGIRVSRMLASDADWSFGHGRAQFLTGEL